MVNAVEWTSEFARIRLGYICRNSLPAPRSNEVICRVVDDGLETIRPVPSAADYDLHVIYKCVNKRGKLEVLSEMRVPKMGAAT